MKSWFCIVRAGNWEIMKRQGLFGVNSSGKKYLSHAKPNDFLVVYAGRGAGVVGICKIISRPFVSSERIWANGYPYRVRIAVLFDSSKRPLPVSRIFGTKNHQVEITPYMLGSTLIEVRPSWKVPLFLKKQNATLTGENPKQMATTPTRIVPEQRGK